MNLTQENAIKEISEWAKASHAYLCNREGYPRGYRDGISQAKIIVSEILSQIEVKQDELKNKGAIMRYAVDKDGRASLHFNKPIRCARDWDSSVWIDAVEVFGEIPKELESITWNDEPIELKIKFEIKSMQ